LEQAPSRQRVGMTMQGRTGTSWVGPNSKSHPITRTSPSSVRPYSRVRPDPHISQPFSLFSVFIFHSTLVVFGLHSQTFFGGRYITERLDLDDIVLNHVEAWASAKLSESSLSFGRSRACERLLPLATTRSLTLATPQVWM
jgi:hypothetical protein